MDEEKAMYERYAALFALRNHGGDEAVSAIIDSLHSESALLKHEVDNYPLSLWYIGDLKQLIVNFVYTL